MNHPNDHHFIYCPRWLALRARDIILAMYDPPTDHYNILTAGGLDYETDTDLSTHFEAALLDTLGPVDQPTSPLIATDPRSYVRADRIVSCEINPNGVTQLNIIAEDIAGTALPDLGPVAVNAVIATKDEGLEHMDVRMDLSSEVR